MFSEFLVLIVLGTVIIVIMPGISITILFSSLLILSIYHFLTKKIVERNGKKIHLAQSDLLMQLTLTFNAIKEIKLAKNENYFKAQVHNTQKRYIHAIKNCYDIGNIPRMLLESWTVTIAMGIMIFMLVSGVSITKIIFLTAFFIGASFRILPSLTRIQHNIFSIKQNYYLFTLIYENLRCKTEKIRETKKTEEVSDFKPGDVDKYTLVVFVDELL